MNETQVFDVALAPLMSLVVTSVINIPALILNVFLVVVFIKSPSLHTLENSSFINLVVTDIVVGLENLGVSVFLILSFEDFGYHYQVCLGFTMFNSYSYSVLMFGLGWLTIDRFVKVVYPFTYNRICRRKNIVVILVLTHVSSIITMFLSLVTFEWDGEHYCVMYYLELTDNLISFYVILFCIFMVLLALNFKILMVAGQQRRAIMAQARPAASAETQATSTKNISKVLGILTLFTFVTHLPSWFYVGLLIAGVDINESASDGLAFTSIILWNCNSLVDALAFLYRKDIKLCTLNLLKAIRGQQTSELNN